MRSDGATPIDLGPASRFLGVCPRQRGSYVPSTGVLRLRATPGDDLGRKRGQILGSVDVAIHLQPTHVTSEDPLPYAVMQ